MIFETALLLCVNFKSKRTYIVRAASCRLPLVRDRMYKPRSGEPENIPAPVAIEQAWFDMQGQAITAKFAIALSTVRGSEIGICFPFLAPQVIEIWAQWRWKVGIANPGAAQNLRYAMLSAKSLKEIAVFLPAYPIISTCAPFLAALMA